MSGTGIVAQTKKTSSQKLPWSSIWGRPPGAIKIKPNAFAKKCSGKSRHGGVAICAKAPVPLIPVGYNTLHETTRWTIAAIPLAPCGALSRRFLHIISFYGIPNRDAGPEYTQNERLLELLFQHASSLGPNQCLYAWMATQTVTVACIYSRFYVLNLGLIWLNALII